MRIITSSIIYYRVSFLSIPSLTFCGVQQSHHEAVDSQIQQQILDHLQQIIWYLKRRQSIMTTPMQENALVAVVMKGKLVAFMA